MDYVLTDQGRAFLREALTTCNKYSLSWYQLWSATSPEADEARRFLDFSPEAVSEEQPGESAKLFGAYAVVNMLQNIASGEEDPSAGIALLGKADLLTDEIVEAAAGTFGLSSAELWDIFIPGR
jgi:hypothetical protein